MKVALLLSGFVRSYNFCHNVRKFIDSNKDFEIDVFIFIWGAMGNLGKPWREHMLKNASPVDVDKVRKIISPKKLEVGSLKIFYKTIGDHMRNMKAEYYGVSKSFDLVDKDYDYVMKSRFDVSYDIDLSKIKFEDGILTPENLIVGYGIENGVPSYYHDGERKVEIETGDEYYNFMVDNEVDLRIDNRVALSNYENMKVYCDLYNNLEDLSNDSFWKELDRVSYQKKANTSHESILSYHLKKSGINYSPTKFLDCDILRS